MRGSFFSVHSVPQCTFIVAAAAVAVIITSVKDEMFSCRLLVCQRIYSKNCK